MMTLIACELNFAAPCAVFLFTLSKSQKPCLDYSTVFVDLKIEKKL